MLNKIFFKLFALPVLMDLEPVQRTNKQSQKASRHISYLTKRTVQTSPTLDIATSNPKPSAPTTRP